MKDSTGEPVMKFIKGQSQRPLFLYVRPFGNEQWTIAVRRDISNPKEYSCGEAPKWQHKNVFPGGDWITSEELLKKMRYIEIRIIWEACKQMIREVRVAREVKKVIREQMKSQ